MDFNNRNGQKKRDFSENFNHNNSNKENDNNMIPEIIYDNYDDPLEDHSNDNLKINKKNSENNINNININNNNINDINKNVNSNMNTNNNVNTDDFIDEFPDFTLNETNKENEMINRPVDVRIIVDGPEKSEFLSKAIKNISLLDDFNIIISSIITTNNVEIAKNAVAGSNIILVAINPDEEGEKIFSRFSDALKTDLNYVEFLKFPKLRDIEVTDIRNVENEVKNSIIRAGFASIFDISNINQVKSEVLQLTQTFQDSQAINEKLALENDMLIEEAKDLRQTNEKLNTEMKDLQNYIDEVKLDFTDFKSRYSNMHSRNLLEVFLIKELWIEVFSEALTDEEVDKIVIATNKFRPENVIVGQDYIGAISKEDARDWLKIVKTALIFVESDNNALQEEMINYYKKKQSHEHTSSEKFSEDYSNTNSNSYSNTYSNDYSEDSRNDSNNHYNNDSIDIDNRNNNNPNYKDHNRNITNDKRRKNTNEYDSENEDEDYDYDITNQFQNFWD